VRIGKADVAISEPGHGEEAAEIEQRNTDDDPAFDHEILKRRGMTAGKSRETIIIAWRQ